MQVEVSVASPLEVENLKIENNVMTFNPVFYGNARNAGLVLAIKVKDAMDNVLTVNHVRLSSLSGRCILTDCTRPVEPLCDKLARQSMNNGQPAKKEKV